jgi:drug/metabolite transporter (DMT)-like permease
MFDKILILVSMFLWGANWTAAKLVSTTMPATLLVFYRFSLTSILFIPLLYFFKIPFKVSKKDLVLIFICSVLMGLYQVCFFDGLKTGLAGAGGVIVTTINPIFTYILVAITTKRHLSKGEYGGLFIGLCSGLIFLRVWDLSLDYLLYSGTLTFIFAAFLWAIVTVIGQHVKAHSITYTFYLFLLITPFMMLGSTIDELLLITKQTQSFYLTLFYLSAFGTIVSTSGFFYLTQKSGAKASSSYIFLVPFFAVIVSYFLLSEPLTLTTILGGACAISSMLVLGHFRGKEKT